MKYLIIAGLFILTGCTAMTNWTDAQAVCASDPKCLEQTKSYAKIGETVASGFGPIAGAGAGAVIAYLALGILGLKKKKQGAK